MMKQVLLFFCFASALSLSVSESKSNSLQNPAIDSFSFGYIQTKTPQNCSYLVIISTSCSSPKFTWEKIGIAFGDAHGNEKKMMKQVLLFFCFASALSLSVSESKSNSLLNPAIDSFSFGYIQVYKERLDGPGTFEQCSLDVFEINGACLSDICFLWLYRSGAVDDWKPESVKISCNNACFPIFNIHFNINFSLPDAAWYGYKWCNSDPPYLANGFPFPTGVVFF
ncbi:embryo-specific protein ATS3B isoform X1 [Vigna radiata var. radiata]|uniref:Embryo-specific protein ATS3B isoform X1 n=1 Tax=Vigna radiata var. radiata TaxID=3916 RepID=A0A1S3VGI1_VIGRR|nr:embryo-specific protein ATS3B isoform X1 [Vigna radiata var. radiata]